MVPWFLLRHLHLGLGEVVLDTQVPDGQGSFPWQLLGYSKKCVQYLRETLCEDQSHG